MDHGQQLVKVGLGSFLVATCTLLVCPHATAQEGADDDGLRPGEVLIVETGDGGRYWRQIDGGENIAPRYPRGLARANIEGCVGIGFVIQPDGTPTAFRLLKSGSTYPSRETRKAMGAALVASIQQWRYEPGEENPRRFPGFAYATSSFGVGRDAESESKRWSAYCEVDDLGVFMRARGAKGREADDSEDP